MSKFNAKILLFGEYSLLYNSMGLAIPYPQFSGTLKTSNQNTEERIQSNLKIKGLFQSLNNQKAKLQLLTIDLVRFENDLEKGLFFESTIPVKHGIGSSGALVAAIYDRYITPRKNWSAFDSENLDNLKKQLSILESFFHGQSSGIDPLTSYLNKPVLVNKKNQVQVLDEDFLGQEKLNPFIIDTGEKAGTGDQMEYFINLSTNAKFVKEFQEKYISAVNSVTTLFLSEEKDDFFQQLKIISEFQLKYFQPMIPESYIPIVKQGLESGKYFLKLCGSGGGFLLGFGEEPNLIKSFKL